MSAATPASPAPHSGAGRPPSSEASPVDGLSHDCHSLLSSIVRMAGSLRDQLPAGSSQRALAADVLLAAERAVVVAARITAEAVRPGSGPAPPKQQPSASTEGSDAVEAMPPPKGRNEHILVVDDNPGILNLAERMLTRLGYRVTTSDSSVGALEMFRSKPSHFNLIVTDLNMPALSGNDLAEKVWGTRPGIPILAITGNSDDLPQNALRDQRFADVLLKPFSMRALGTATFRALNADL